MAMSMLGLWGVISSPALAGRARDAEAVSPDSAVEVAVAYANEL